MRFYTKKIFFLLTVISVCMLMCLNVHAKSEDFTGKGTGFKIIFRRLCKYVLKTPPAGQGG